jgi:hypothetical protein
MALPAPIGAWAARPELIAAAAAAGAALLLALLVGAVLQLRRPRPRAAQRVRDLARRGVAPAEIARRTRLSRDAVALALSVESAAAVRRNLPSSARIAAPESAGPGAPSFGAALQIAERQRDTGAAPDAPLRARPLPPRRPRTFTFQRSAAWASSPE